VCVGIDNQYSFEVPGYQIYLDPPILPEVLINKDDGVTIVGTPGSTTYTLTITNTTQAAAMPIPGPEVVDTLPVGMSFVSCAVNPPLVGTCAESAPGSNIVNVQLGAQSATIPAYLPGTDAAPNNVGTMTISANVAPGLAAGTALTNTASVDWTDVFGNDYPPVSDDDIDTVISLPTTADVSVVKTDQPDPVMPGGVLTYTLVISNAGPANAANVVVTDTLPAGVTFASAVPAQTSGPNPLTWNLGTVAAETRRTITVVVNVNPSAQCAIMNTASVSSTTPDPNPGNNGDDEPTAVSGADLQISKSDNPDPVASGAVLTYTLLITNAGPAAAQSVVVTDALPAGVTFANANPAPSSLGNPLTWNLGNMVSGARQTITVVVDVDPATSGQILNTTRVSSTAPDCDPGNNADDEPTTVRPSTAVELLYFRVNSVDNPQVHVGWATAAEIDNFGFKLYRAPVDDFSRGQLIHFEPSSIGGAGPGATYEYVDSVPAEGVWWYWLADLDTQGVETVHGPISAGVGAAALPHRVFVPLILRVP
jgi:uncharacterized repeat protein (TIGR01451 family)